MLPSLFALVIFQVGYTSHEDGIIGTHQQACLLGCGLASILLVLVLNPDPSDLCLWSIWDYRHEPVCLALTVFILKHVQQKFSNPFRPTILCPAPLFGWHTHQLHHDDI
jgi:hypothetical protein